MIKKSEIIATLFIIFLIIFTIGVIAASLGEGGDTRNLSDNNATNNTNNNVSTNNTDINATQPIKNETKNKTKEYQPRDCESFNKTVDRIRCRIIQGENYTAPNGTIPEACKLQNETKRGRCVAFYRTIQTCYNLPLKAKDACFKRASGLVKKFSEEAQEGRKEKARDYMITLLYELEERVEKTRTKGKISDDAAANLIDKIIEIKKAVLEGKTKAEIKTMLKDLKETWKTSKIKIDSATIEGEGNE